LTFDVFSSGDFFPALRLSGLLFPGGESMQVSIYEGEAEEWDCYIRRHKASTFYHQIGWKNVVEKTYGHQPFYLVARGQKIRGVLPLFLMKHVLFGKFLISVPFGDYGGICADNQDTAYALLAEAIYLARNTRVKFLELRHLRLLTFNDFNGLDNNRQLLTKTSRAALILSLEQDPQLLWKRLKPKVRNQVRKAKKSGLEIEFGDKKLVQKFYDVYAHNMRDLGTPAHSLSFFQNILTEFPHHTSIILVKFENRTIGGAVATYFKDIMEIPWASSLREFFPYCPNNLLYWAALEYGCLKGYKHFNFGRSPWDSGTFRFKKQWGAKPVRLYYQYHLLEGDEMPDYTPSTSSRFDIAIWLWKRLPVNLTKIIGPRIIAGIPY
jgi:serine/alanine adding enzyme